MLLFILCCMIGLIFYPAFILIFTKHISLRVKTFLFNVLLLFIMGSIFKFCSITVILPNYGNVAWIFRSIDVMAKTLYECWGDHLCSKRVGGTNVAGVLIIKAEKCTWIDITCTVTIGNDLLPYHIFLNL